MRTRFAVALLAALVLVPSAGALAANPPATPGAMVQRTYGNTAGTRTYYLYVPTSGAAGKPLMIWLHGCGGPLTMAAGHALAQVAEEKGFVLAYPVQDPAANPAQCWNWFVDADIHRGSGEASIVAGITTSLIAELGIDQSRVYIGGYSAGGAMTTVMGAAYPDLYAAISPQAGAPYDFDAGQKAYAEMGARARPMPAWFLQGATDEISNYVIGRTNLLQWLNTDDLADDGQSNSSVAKTPSSLEPATFQTSLGPVPVTVEHYVDDGCELARFVTSPLEHLANGYLMSEDAGLDMQRSMMAFLLAHRMGAPGVGCG
jgi:poly(hydroxyalkanoate) depolymerase family esterase